MKKVTFFSFTYFATLIILFTHQFVFAQVNQNKAPLFQLVSDGDFENLTPQNVSNLANFNIRGNNEPELFIGKANITNLKNNLPQTKSGRPYSSVDSWDKDNDNHHLMLSSKVIWLSSQPPIYYYQNAGVSFHLADNTKNDSLYQLSIKVLSKCNQKLHLVFSSNPPCSKAYGPENGEQSNGTNLGNHTGKLVTTICNNSTPFRIGFDTTIVITGDSSWQKINFQKRLRGSYSYLTIYGEGEVSFPNSLNLSDAYFIDDVELLAIGALNAFLAFPVTCAPNSPNPCNLVCLGEIDGLFKSTQLISFSNMYGYVNQNYTYRNTPDIVKNNNTNTANIYNEGSATPLQRLRYLCLKEDSIIDNAKVERVGEFLHLYSINAPTLDAVYGEGIFFPLKKALTAGDMYSFSFDYAQGCNNKVVFVLSKEQPCIKARNMPVANAPSNCSAGVTYNQDLIIFPSTTSLNITSSTDNSTPPKTINNWETYKASFTVPPNLAGLKFLSVYVIPDITTAQQGRSLYLDDIKIEEKIDRSFQAITQNCSTNTLKLIANNTNPNVTYLWSVQYPNGTILNNSLNSFDVPNLALGVYKITLTTSNGSCSTASTVQNITINAPISADFSNVINCLNLTSTAANSLGSHTWTIKKNGITIGVPGTGSIYNTSLQPGIYEITHDINISPCPTITSVKMITITSNPTAASILISETSNIPNDGNICAGATTILSVPSTAGFTYLWSTGATTNSITLNPNITTSYSVTVTNLNSCTSIATSTITVFPLPTILISVSENSGIPNDGNICNGFTAVLSVPNIAGFTYSRNGILSNSITVTPSTTSTYTLVVTNSNGCSTVSSRTITVTQFPNADFTYTLICPDISLNANVYSGTHSWSVIGATNTSTSPNPTMNFPNGVYTVKHTLSNNGCAVTVNKDITVNCATPLDCPCNNALYNLGDATQAGGVNLSQTTLYQQHQNILASNGCITITGRFVIDVPYEFDNLEIIMQPGAEIVVDVQNGSNYGLTLNNVYLHSCYRMWRGIRVENGQLFRSLNGTKIENAYIGVTLKSYARGSITYTTFNEDYQGVKYEGATGNTDMISTKIKTNVFKCDTPLLPRWDGTNLGVKSQVGIYGQNAAFLIGEYTKTGSVNEFKDIYNGIFLVGCATEMYYPWIHDLTAPSSYTPDLGNLLLGASNDLGIWSWGSKVGIQYASISGISRGIYLENTSQLTMRNSNINSEYQGMYISNSGFAPGDFTIQNDNTIRSQYIGISIKDLHNSKVNISKENKIIGENKPVSLQTSLGYAIGINAINTGTQGIKIISDNTINFDSDGCITNLQAKPPFCILY